jgi:beta-xylosidase
MIKFKFPLLFFLFMSLSSVIKSQESPLVIFPGDYPDPTILRDGDDYYMTHSSFYYMPGFLIWHSKDLVNWEPVSRAIPEYTGSAMAPDLIKYKGRFYLYYPAKGTNWVVWTDNIKGRWSAPIDLKVSGIDPGHVVGEDEKRYLYVDNGFVVQLSDDGLSTIGERKKVYDGWEYPKTWKTEGMYLESPKLMFKDGYYYLISAQGGTAGPATSHMVIAARSKKVLGPWENSPYNPVIHTYSANDNWWSKGHGTLVDDTKGNWYMVYHAYSSGNYPLGRQTLIEPVEWTSDGWFKQKVDKSNLPPLNPENLKLSLSDEFTSNKLGLQWTFWKENASQKLSFQSGSLIIPAMGTTPADARKLLTTAIDDVYEVSVNISPEKNTNAGLMLFYNEKAFAGILTNSRILTIYKKNGISFSVPNKFGKSVYLKILNDKNCCTFYASSDKKSWIILAKNVDVSEMHHNNFKGFYALRPALVATGRGVAKFRQFVYKNAVPAEKDMSAYLMVFHKDETHGLYMALSNDGYSFTALNNGHPVIAGDTIADQKGIRDPHIYRGPDGAFYMSMTDLHVFAKRDGLRDTEWERDGNVYGWGNNRDLVLMKSRDLINWNRTNLRFPEISAQFAEIGCAWAPETMYDKAKGKLMLYFTMRYKNEANKLYYAYVNNDYTKLETIPQLLFEYPDEEVSAIDADITDVDGKYHMFYVSHDGQAGIKQAVSDKLNEGYHFDPRWYDPETKSCEAPNVWKRIGEDKYVLMYDVYGIKPANFGFSETSDFVNFTDIGHFNEGVMQTTNFISPKHGAIIQITKEEADQLAKKWNLKMKFKTAEEYYQSITNKTEKFSETPSPKIK